MNSLYLVVVENPLCIVSHQFKSLEDAQDFVCEDLADRGIEDVQVSVLDGGTKYWAGLFLNYLILPINLPVTGQNDA